MNSEHTITQLHTKLTEGSLTPKKLLEETRSCIETSNEEINAFIEVFEDIDLPETDGFPSVLSGIPVGIKDNIVIKGRDATAASKILQGHTAVYDAFVIEKLKEAGAVIVGRLNMDEAAMGSSTETSYFGPTKNPRDTSRVPGGSSGGPAAAVAAQMVPYTLGSDTGGSIRQPASFCGIVGMKPTYGAVSRSGLIAMASSLDCIGPFTHSVEDAQTVFNIISAYDPNDSTCVPMETRKKYQEKNTNKKVIGVPRAFLKLEGVDQEVLENFEAGLEKMREQGYTVVDIDIPHIELSLAVYYIIQPAEASSNLARYDGIRYGLHTEGETLLDVYMNTKTEGFGEEVQRRIMLGTHVLSSGYHDQYYYKAQALRREISKHISEVLDQVDIIATPTTPTVAFKLGEKADPLSMYLQDVFTVPYNLSGHPAISIPSGTNPEGLPFGMHFVAPLFCEEKLFEASRDFERAILKA